MTPTPGLRHLRQLGFSLIELMVALTLGLFLMVAISVAYMSSKTGFTYANNTSRLAEDAAFALGYIARDVRMAGFAGCAGTVSQSDGASPPTFTYTPSIALLNGQTLPATPNPFTGITNASTLGLADVFTARNAVYGFDSTDSGARSALGTSSGYSISTANPILYLAGGSSYTSQIATAMPTTTSTLTVTSRPSPWPNQNNMVFVISDCSQGDVFQSSSVTTTTIDHPSTANATAALSKAYGTDALVAPVNTATYFVATRSGAATSSLYRRSFNGSSVVVEELVPNVEAILFYYGENTNSSTTDGTGTDTSPSYLTNVYRTSASAVTDWSRVVSVRIGLIIVSDDDNITQSSGQSLSWLGGTYTPTTTDRRLRRSFSTTVSVRNRMGL